MLAAAETGDEEEVIAEFNSPRPICQFDNLNIFEQFLEKIAMNRLRDERAMIFSASLANGNRERE